MLLGLVVILIFLAFYFGKAQGSREVKLVKEQSRREVQLAKEQLDITREENERLQKERDNFYELQIIYKQDYEQEKEAHGRTLIRAEHAEGEREELRVDLAMATDTIDIQRGQISSFANYLCLSETDYDELSVSFALQGERLHQSRSDNQQLRVELAETSVKAQKVDQAASFYHRSIVFFVLSFILISVVLGHYYLSRKRELGPVYE